MIYLKQTGVTRRIDELGRIVIPKEIRKNLKIRNNDELLINVNDDSIILSKYEKVSEDVLKSLVKAISKEIKKNVIITSKDKVIVSSDNKYHDLELSNSIISKIENRDTFSSLIPTKISLFNEIIEVAYVVSPFCVSSDVIGSIIVFSQDAINTISVECINIIKKFLENYLED